MPETPQFPRADYNGTIRTDGKGKGLAEQSTVFAPASDEPVTIGGEGSPANPFDSTGPAFDTTPSTYTPELAAPIDHPGLANEPMPEVEQADETVEEAPEAPGEPEASTEDADGEAAAEPEPEVEEAPEDKPAPKPRRRAPKS